ncbi:hypothetical protein J1N35_031290 [Gossypium stocksii]|uniref:Uncharacterized protein n=1 Tax=Gossypium stocksii TaxID=47602 RepID=A0A9D3V177_9ROSI|nr:hypothetical protein J1N35_031290 [Gossypium stocksii]
MGLVGAQEYGKGEMALPLGNKSKYKRMDSELSDEFDDEASNFLACAIFASLNNIVPGYGK